MTEVPSIRRCMCLTSIAALLLACGALIVQTASASADPLLECSGALHETLNPGLTD